MYTPEVMIDCLKRNIELAPSLQQNEEDGGSVSGQYGLIEKAKEQMAMAGNLKLLRPVEGGARRYTGHMQTVLTHLERLEPIYAEVASVKGANYSDGEQRQKAMGRLKEHSAKIVAECKGAIAALEAAMGVVNEGERKEVRK